MPNNNPSSQIGFAYQANTPAKIPDHPTARAFAPHITSELWRQLKSPGEITQQTWPAYDEAVLVEDEVEIVLQVNGKVRDRITMPLASTSEELEVAARANEKVRNAVGSHAIRKVVVVPKKLVNIVAA